MGLVNEMCPAETTAPNRVLCPWIPAINFQFAMVWLYFSLTTWMWQNLADQPTRVQVITWCRLARSEYLSHWWPIWRHIKLDDFPHQIIAMTFYLQNRECENASVDYYEMSSYFQTLSWWVLYRISIPKRSIGHHVNQSRNTSIAGYKYKIFK